MNDSHIKYYDQDMNEVPNPTLKQKKQLTGRMTKMTLPLKLDQDKLARLIEWKSKPWYKRIFRRFK